MKNLTHYLRQVHQRRMTAFYLLGYPGDNEIQSLRDGRRNDDITFTEDRPRSLREMFADVEYENEDDGA